MAITEWEICRASVGEGHFQIILRDDDPTFLRMLHAALVRIFEKLRKQASITSFSGPAGTPPELLTCCDLAFLDIDYESGDQNGIDLARMLRQVNPRGLIFFVTNFIDYAPAGYEVQAFRYILKRDMDQVLERYILQALEQFAEGQVSLRLRGKDELADIPLERISYLEVLDHQVSIHGEDAVYAIGATLSGFEKEMEKHGFLRIHKSYLVNMSHIRKFRSRECLLTDSGG